MGVLGSLDIKLHVACTGVLTGYGQKPKKPSRRGWLPGSNAIICHIVWNGPNREQERRINFNM